MVFCALFSELTLLCPKHHRIVLVNILFNILSYALTTVKLELTMVQPP